MATLKIDRCERIDIYETYDGGMHLQASILLRPGYTPELVIPQRGHSKIINGVLSTFLSGQVLQAIEEAVATLHVPQD